MSVKNRAALLIAVILILLSSLPTLAEDYRVTEPEIVGSHVNPAKVGDRLFVGSLEFTLTSAEWTLSSSRGNWWDLNGVLTVKNGRLVRAIYPGSDIAAEAAGHSLPDGWFVDVEPIQPGSEATLTLMFTMQDPPTRPIRLCAGYGYSYYGMNKEQGDLYVAYGCWLVTHVPVY
jgi:hypothetical protein